MTENISITAVLQALSQYWEDGKLVPERVDRLADSIREHNAEDPTPMLFGQTLEEVLSTPQEEE